MTKVKYQKQDVEAVIIYTVDGGTFRYDSQIDQHIPETHHQADQIEINGTGGAGGFEVYVYYYTKEEKKPMAWELFGDHIIRIVVINK